MEDGGLEAEPLQRRGSLPQRLSSELPARRRAEKPAPWLEAGEGKGKGGGDCILRTRLPLDFVFLVQYDFFLETSLPSPVREAEYSRSHSIFPWMPRPFRHLCSWRMGQVVPLSGGSRQRGSPRTAAAACGRYGHSSVP